MKKLLFLLFLLLSASGFGQEHLIGVQAGVNFANLTANEVFSDMKSRVGFTGGINYEIKISNQYRIGIDALYSQKGFSDKMIFIDAYGNQIGESAIFKNNYDYLELPLKIAFEMGNKIKIIPGIGIVPSFLLKAGFIEPKFDSGGNVVGKESHNHKDYASKFDLGALAEVKIESKLSNNIILCPAIAYKHSLTTLSNSNYFNGSKLRHYGFSVSIGLKYKLKSQ